MNTFHVQDDPTQPPANPAAPVLRDEPTPMHPTGWSAASDFVETFGEPPD